MTTSSANHAANSGRPIPVEELARQQGVTTVKTIEDLRCDGIVETDEEVDELLAFVREQRNGSLA